MADIGRYCINDVIDRLTLLVAAQQGMADEGMSQIAKARRRMAAAYDPLQTGAQSLESGMNGAVGNGNRRHRLDCPPIGALLFFNLVSCERIASVIKVLRSVG